MVEEEWLEPGLATLRLFLSCRFDAIDDDRDTPLIHINKFV